MSDPQSHATRDDQQIPSHAQIPTSAQDQENQFLFLCKLDYARVIANLLQALYWRKDLFLTIQATAAGLKFTVEDGKCLQVSTFLSDKFFQDYKYWPNQENGSGHEGLLHLPIITQFYMATRLEENEVVTDCAIRAIEAEPLLDFNFRSQRIPNKVVIQSDKLRDAMNELDWSAPFLEFTLSPEFPSFRMRTEGASGSFEVVFPKESEVFETFESTEGQTYIYRLSSIQPAAKALSISKKTSIRISEDGLLSFQLLVLHDTGQKSFIEFYTLPQCTESMEF